MTKRSSTSPAALTKAALTRILNGESASGVVAAALRGMENDPLGRAQLARRVLGTAILRIALAYQAGSAAPAALLAAYVRFVENGEAWPRPWPADPIERLVCEGSCPRLVAEEIARSLGVVGALEFLRASNVPGPRTLRANRLRTTRGELRQQLREEGIATRPASLAPNALHVEGPANLFGSTAWRSVLFEVQDEASQLVIDRHTPAEAGQTVVDLCAGRGGKTLALAARLQDRGSLFAYDVDRAALADLDVRLSRAGVSCVHRGLPPLGTADVVLVDSPCSSLGPLRRSPDRRYTLTAEELAALVPVQTGLLEQASRLVRANGVVVYATCTVRREENEFIAHTASLRLEQEHVYLPHLHGTDGFYVAVLRRPGT